MAAEWRIRYPEKGESPYQGELKYEWLGMDERAARVAWENFRAKLHAHANVDRPIPGRYTLERRIVEPWYEQDAIGEES